MDEGANRGIQEVYGIVKLTIKLGFNYLDSRFRGNDKRMILRGFYEELFEGAVVGFACTEEGNLVEFDDATDGVKA
jgi:hypothetical protein